MTFYNLYFQIHCLLSRSKLRLDITSSGNWNSVKCTRFNIDLLCKELLKENTRAELLQKEIEDLKSNNVWLEKAMIYKAKLEELNKIMADDLDKKIPVKQESDFYIKYQ
jgi:hypothetical protein